MVTKMKNCLLYVSIITQEAQRFEDMVDAVNKLVAINPDLTLEERKILYTAYKNAVSQRMVVWRNLSLLEKKEKQQGSQNICLLRNYKGKIESQIKKYCYNALDLIDSKLIPHSNNSQARIFYFKMKGDFYRYICECTSQKQYEEAAKNCENAYNIGSLQAHQSLRVTHPLRIGLALKFSVFFYEVKNDSKTACQLARQSFSEAIEANLMEEEQFEETATILLILRDSLNLWTQKFEEV